MKGEIFKKIPGIEDYEVSNYGRVKSLKNNKEKILKPHLSHNGYRRINFSFGKKYTHKKIGYLVLLAFVGPREPGMTVSHLDGNNKNDRLDNLIYETLLDNARRRKEQGGYDFNLGEKNNKSKLKVYEVKKIKKLLQDDKFTQNYIAAMYNISQSTISHIKNNRTWNYL